MNGDIGINIYTKLTEDGGCVFTHLLVIDETTPLEGLSTDENILSNCQMRHQI